ncbi:SH3 domain-containing protein [Tropicimonas aquimaris]|uniref:SH3 domain-containing protein n=1 Tax=Tropicimonas aquimaris TaxID=914152 RepID=A0ABW3IQ86_9RHOB
MGRQATRSRFRGVFTAIAAILLGMAISLPPALAQEQDSQGTRGTVTNLPLPRFVSLKSTEGNARRGPSLSHRIDWVYKRRAMPLQITAEYGHWRRVQDRDGAGGWMHYSLLSGVRTVLVEKDMAALHARPSEDAEVLAKVQAGVVARLGECTLNWCRITAGGSRGWTQKSALWGVSADEIRE